MARDTVRTADVVLGVECALPAGFEAYDAGRVAVQSGATARWRWRRLAAGALLLFCLTLGTWRLHA